MQRLSHAWTRLTRESVAPLGNKRQLDVVIAQTTLLSNQQALLNVQIEEMTSAVQLITSLGGGWDSTQLPTTRQVEQWPTTQETAIQK